MNSNDISEKLGSAVFKWLCFDSKGIEELPDCEGVYVIRMAHGKTMGRLKGDSDIIYIGCGKVKTRLSAHLNPRSDFADKGWLITLVKKEYKLEFGYFVSPIPANEELELLLGYLKEHLELPPLNRQTKRLSNVWKVRFLLPSLTPVQARRLIEEEKDKSLRSTRTDDTLPPTSHG